MSIFRVVAPVLLLTATLCGTLTSGQTYAAPETFTDNDVRDNRVDDAVDDDDDIAGDLVYPFVAFGNLALPQQEDLLIQNTTVWTLERDGVMHETDVLVSKGEIRRIGKSLKAGKARVIDGTGKHLTPGLIDEHSHIALDSINDRQQPGPY